MKGFSSLSMELPTNAFSPCIPAKENKREESENYRAIIAKLNANWRVIECRDGIQWILQRRAGNRHGEPRWEGRSYCRNKESLLGRVRDLTGECDGIAHVILGSFPEWMGVAQ